MFSVLLGVANHLVPFLAPKKAPIEAAATGAAAEESDTGETRGGTTVKEADPAAGGTAPQEAKESTTGAGFATPPNLVLFLQGGKRSSDSSPELPVKFGSASLSLKSVNVKSDGVS